MKSYKPKYILHVYENDGLCWILNIYTNGTNHNERTATLKSENGRMVFIHTFPEDGLPDVILNPTHNQFFDWFKKHYSKHFHVCSKYPNGIAILGYGFTNASSEEDYWRMITSQTFFTFSHLHTCNIPAALK